ncbi:hypothetical protein [Natrinema sp. DC36]|uniref:hypothetical protein n=1 Tax=Natrinema sp. DC36 TaxID=2878680 RepID=UPI001CF098CC|nr:hypothetical protein [Natrinema sp. DC36]
MSDIIVTDNDTLDRETAVSKSQTPNGHAPYGVAGMFVDDAHIVCAGCVSDEEWHNEDNSVMFGDAESDYPGTLCADCEKPLDTHILVYKSQDPKLFFRLRMSEELGEYNECLTIEQIAEKAKEKAYEMGYAEASPIEGEYGEGGEFADSKPEVPTDSARWANILAPKLRSIAGYEDSGYGTYQELPIDVVHDIYNEDVSTAFREGYYDCAEGKEQ